MKTPRGALILDIMDIFWTSSIPLSDKGSPEIQKQFNVMQSKGFMPLQLSISVWIPAGFESADLDPSNIKILHIAPHHMSLDDWGALFDVDVYTEPRGMLIADLVFHVSEQGYRRSDETFARPKEDFSLADLLECLDADAEILQNYQDATRRSIRQRLTSYSNLELFSGAGTELAALIRPFHSTVLMLGRLPDELKKVVVAVLIRRILRARRDASFAQKRLDLDGTIDDRERARLEQFVAESIPRAWVLMDEAHVLAGIGPGSVASEALTKYAKEGRNYGLSLAVATQQPSALDPRLTSQIETLVSHQLTAPEDAMLAARAMRSPAPGSIKVDGICCDVGDLLRRLDQGTAVFSCGNAPSLLRSCILAIRPRVTAHGGYEA